MTGLLTDIATVVLSDDANGEPPEAEKRNIDLRKAKFLEFIKRFWKLVIRYGVIILSAVGLLLSYTISKQTANFSENEEKRRNLEIKDRNLEIFRSKMDLMMRIIFWLDGNNAKNINLDKTQNSIVNFEKYTEYAHYDGMMRD